MRLYQRDVLPRTDERSRCQARTSRAMAAAIRAEAPYNSNGSRRMWSPSQVVPATRTKWSRTAGRMSHVACRVRVDTGRVGQGADTPARRVREPLPQRDYPKGRERDAEHRGHPGASRPGETPGRDYGGLLRARGGAYRFRSLSDGCAAPAVRGHLARSR